MSRNIFMDKSDLKILMIDDEEPAFMMLSAGLSKYGFTVIWESNHEKELVIRRIAKEKPDVIVLDIMFRGKNEGKVLLHEIKKSRYKDKPVIMLTDTMKNYRDEDYPGAAFPFAKVVFRMGDRAFADLASQIRDFLDKADDIAPNDKRFGFIVGNTPAMLDVCRTILKVAPTDATVLITGESGTGKEAVAKALQRLSLRKDKPFIPINCAALPDENLLISTLFGHEKGTFTGAAELRKGIFETASGGTVFLDEIGDAPPQVQDKLLRALREKEILRLGSPAPIKVDIRVLCATNKNLRNEIESGRFRGDLYQRIAIVEIHLPPLRERTDEDIRMYYSYFINKYNVLYNKTITDILNDELLDAFNKYNWPGNIAEFESKIERAIIHVKGNVLLPKDFHFGETENESAGILGNAEEIIANKFWERKVKLDDFGDYTKQKGLKQVVVKLIERWLNEKQLRPKRKELADCMGTTDDIMGQIFSKCDLKLTDWPKTR